jgi:hypothetical protein
MHMAHAVAMVRRDIGDPTQAFLTNALSDGMTVIYDLPPQNINPLNLSVQMITGSSTTTLLPVAVPGSVTLENSFGVAAFPAWAIGTAYLAGALVSYGPNPNYYQALTGTTGQEPDLNPLTWGAPLTTYTLDGINGTLTFNLPLPLNSTLRVQGQAWGMFSDIDLNTIIEQAAYEHCEGQTLTERYRSGQGFITYRDTPKTLWNLPKREENLVITLADIEAFWGLASDAASDVNVDTADGTSIDRAARYNQLMTHIESLTEKYISRCAQLGVGLFRIESLNLRRVSRTNNRLVPIFREREYDDHRYPVRELPQIDRRDEDTSGVPSPIWNGLPL